MLDPDLSDPAQRAALREFYYRTLTEDVLPFWLQHGLDREHGGIITSLNRDGSVLDTDKSVWFQGRAAWMLATVFNTVDRRDEWLDAARSCIEFLRQYGSARDGKLYFIVSREGAPLRMRRYVFSESFAAIAYAAYAKATGQSRAADDAVTTFARYLRYCSEPGVMTPKLEPTRPLRSVGPLMIGLVTAQELRANLGDVLVSQRTCTDWITHFIAEIENYFVKPELAALMETVGPHGEFINHHDGRTLNPGHAIECAWFILHEGSLRNDQRLVQLGATILDWMWARGWDPEFGGILYFRDVYDLPVQEYWHDMKFWWPHNEAIIATLLAHRLTGEPKYATWHQAVHNWSFRHFADSQYGEWYGYLHRDGRLSSPVKGSIYKGPFHLPRMLWYGWIQLGLPYGTFPAP